MKVYASLFDKCPWYNARGGVLNQELMGWKGKVQASMSAINS